MTDYSQFEASVKSGIHADVERIRKHDELIGKVLKQRRSSICCFIVSLALAVGVSIVLKNFIPAIILGLVAAFFLWRFWGTGVSEDYMREVYEEGLLVPGMVVNTQPLTILAIANLVAHNGVPVINACRSLVVKELDGAKKELYEKIPCSCFFVMKQVLIIQILNRTLFTGGRTTGRKSLRLYGRQRRIISRMPRMNGKC